MKQYERDAVKQFKLNYFLTFCLTFDLSHLLLLLLMCVACGPRTISQFTYVLFHFIHTKNYKRWTHPIPGEMICFRYFKKSFQSNCITRSNACRCECMHTHIHLHECKMVMNFEFIRTNALQLWTACKMNVDFGISSFVSRTTRTWISVESVSMYIWLWHTNAIIILCV